MFSVPVADSRGKKNRHINRLAPEGAPLVWNVLLAAREAGFGGTISTMAVAMEPEVRDLLGVPADHAICALVPLGKPIRQLKRLRRRAVAAFATRERFDGEPFARA